MKSVMRCFRCSIILNEQLEMIAKYEDRTVSKVIQRLLMKAVEDYREHNREMYEIIHEDNGEIINPDTSNYPH